MNLIHGRLSKAGGLRFDEGHSKLRRGRMGAPLQIAQMDHASAGTLSSRCPDGAQVRRIPARARILDMRSRLRAAEMNGMDRQTLRDRIF